MALPIPQHCNIENGRIRMIYRHWIILNPPRLPDIRIKAVSQIHMEIDADFLHWDAKANLLIKPPCFWIRLYLESRPHTCGYPSYTRGVSNVNTNDSSGSWLIGGG